METFEAPAYTTDRLAEPLSLTQFGALRMAMKDVPDVEASWQIPDAWDSVVVTSGGFDLGNSFTIDSAWES
jgi:hypothetical protein